MKLDVWEAILSLLDAGGIFQYGMYEIRNNHGQLHRDNGPAVVYPNGSSRWYLNGELHRDDGPAVVDPDGTRIWYQNGFRGKG